MVVMVMVTTTALPTVMVMVLVLPTVMVLWGRRSWRGRKYLVE